MCFPKPDPSSNHFVLENILCMLKSPAKEQQYLAISMYASPKSIHCLLTRFQVLCKSYSLCCRACRLMHMLQFQTRNALHRTISHTSTDAGCARAAQCLESLAVCSSLKHLSLSGCSLSALPPSIAELRALTTLLLSENSLVALPTETVEALTNLEELDIRNNALTHLPPQLGFMPRLRSLSLEGNILRTMRRTVLERGTPALLEYLRSRMPS